MLKPEKIYETVLYADDLESARSFYRDVLGLDVVQSSDLFLTFRCGDGVLLVFDRHKSDQPDRSVPAHGTTGAGHVAFAIQPGELDAWRDQLKSKGVEIEDEVEWKSGDVSIYFRDPAGNSLELVPPKIW